MRTVIAILCATLWLSGCGTNPPQDPPSVREAERNLRAGVEAYENSDYAGATAMFSKAHALYRSLDNSEGMILCGINLAETALALRSYERAERQVNAAAALVKANHVEARFGPRIAVLSASAAHGLKKKDLAIERLREVLPAFRADDAPVGSTTGMTAVSAVIVRTRIAFEEGRSEGAMWTRRLERVVNKEAPDDAKVRARLLRFQAQLAQLEGDPNTARRQLNDALSLYRDRAIRPGTAATLNELGRLALETKQLADAQDYLERALYIQTWILNAPGASESLQNLAAVHEAAGDKEKAAAANRWAAALASGSRVNWGDLREDVIPATQ